MNVQRIPIRKLMLYEFEAGHITPQGQWKAFVCAKGKGAVNHSIITRNFALLEKNFDNQVRSGMPKTVDSENVLKAVETAQAIRVRTVSAELLISQSSVIGRSQQK